MVLQEISASDFLKLGLGVHYERYTYKEEGASALKKFRALYGVNPKTCLDLFLAIQAVNAPERIDERRADPYDLLMTIEWLRKYQIESDLACTFGISEKTVSMVIRRYTRAIQALKEDTIQWLWDNEMQGEYETFIVSVDGIHCSIEEPRRKASSKWFSHKTHGPALSYEVAIAIQQSKVVHINGPFPAGVPDISIFRSEEGLKWKMPEGKYGTADRGYLGEAMLRTPNPRDTELAMTFKKRCQARHETFNARLKSFKVLSSQFRHSGGHSGIQPITCHDNHRSAFEAVCVILQFEMDNGRTLFNV